MGRRPWVLIRSGWDCEEMILGDHFGAYAVAELLHLLSDVTQESVTGPPP